jgi:hypothetical protein
MPNNGGVLAPPGPTFRRPTFTGGLLQNLGRSHRALGATSATSSALPNTLQVGAVQDLRWTRFSIEV